MFFVLKKIKCNFENMQNVLDKNEADIIFNLFLKYVYIHF